jgi:hypothetical protein
VELQKWIVAALRKIQSIPNDVTLDQIIEGAFSNNEYSHFIFQLQPPDKDRLRLFDMAVVSASSDYILDTVLAMYERRDLAGARQFYEYTKTSPAAASLRGKVWERRVHAYLSSFGSNHLFSIRSLRPPGAEHQWAYPGGSSTWFASYREISQLVLETKEGQCGGYFMPLATNFPSIDSLVYQPDQLICIQITHRDTHSINTIGLKKVLRELKPRGPLKHLRPTVRAAWQFIFIVPSELASAFTIQQIEGEGANHWGKWIHQYVLGLSSDDLYSRQLAQYDPFQVPEL